ncbi:hypothetical protein JCM8097_001414 [Rhodosporidiobolus ruineniae]
MPFGSPLVPSPTLSKPSASPSLSPSSSSTSPNLDRNTASAASSVVGGGAVGLGVTGAGSLGVPDGPEVKGDITSPVELTQFVDTLLNDLESRFDNLSKDVLSRLEGLSTRVDSLETSLSDLMSGTAGGPVPQLGGSASVSEGTASPKAVQHGA